MTRYGNAEVGEGCRGINVCTTCVHSHLVVVKLSLKMAYFVEEKGWLFAGDAYVHAKVPVALVRPFSHMLVCADEVGMHR
mmetsp:Transcript_34581/g.89659  ORF Transcript_34581/g.89659 Transcript_34581/m.89659 type:complete len:80 (+) Transcript_34581:1191-1430(+)